MERKDYLMREIEKIALLLQSLLNFLTGNKENLAVSIENKFEETCELLKQETGFDFEKFLALQGSSNKEYIKNFKGINPENLELLAEILFQMGQKQNFNKQRVLFEKALLLFELCNQTDKTYSISRESKITQIKNAL
ncbi:MAG: hypothetical protein V1783_03210 [Bacteroidota bacterium]